MTAFQAAVLITIIVTAYFATSVAFYLGASKDGNGFEELMMFLMFGLVALLFVAGAITSGVQP